MRSSFTNLLDDSISSGESKDMVRAGVAHRASITGKVDRTCDI
jgi:hypothetical protein